MTAFDAIIVGSGPAGVSAAFPLVQAGLQVLLVDGGRQARVEPPAGPFLAQRAADVEQWAWMIGRDYHALRNADAVSPKLRVPTHRDVFDDFAKANRLQAEPGFITIGSLARGGLSNAWGCGVTRLSADELAAFPFPADALDASYAAVAQRIGISGAQDDDMADYCGVDAWALPPIPMDDVQSWLWTRYRQRNTRHTHTGFRLGRARVAVLAAGQGERQACNLSGTCLWGCRRRALYSAVEDLALLQRYPNFHHRPGFVVDGIAGTPQLRTITGQDSHGPARHQARCIVLAAGTLASTRLALQALGHHQPVPLQACPTAAFLLWLPRFLGRPHTQSFGLSQLSFTLSLGERVTGFGALFSPTGIPFAEFARYIPLRKRYGIDLLGALLSSCVVSNMFLPGHLTQASLTLAADGSLQAGGHYDAAVFPLLQQARQQLRRHFWSLGALLLPQSFTIGRPGSDIHYSCSLPMRAHPQRGQTTACGELAGLDGVYVADGASLCTLTEKSHTLTIMANADRIGRHLAGTLHRQA